MVVVVSPPPARFIDGPEHSPPYPPRPAELAIEFIRQCSPKRTAFQVFCELLQGLSLDTYPYYTLKHRDCKLPAYAGPFQRYVEQRGDVHTLTQLQLLIEWRASPWYIECDWTSEMDDLQYKLLKARHYIKMSSIFQHFQSLNFTSRGITDYDESMLALRNLKHLSLAGNRLEKFDMTNLPRGVLDVELYGNSVKEIVGMWPATLSHLGIAANHVRSVLSLMQKSYPIRLLSMDVGENDVDDLDDIVAFLSLTPCGLHLKNLRIAGNPCALRRDHRVYLMSRSSGLMSLDEEDLCEPLRTEHLTVDYSSYKSINPAQQTIVLFTLKTLSGIPQPVGYKTPEEQTAYPLAKWVYVVEVSFPGILLPVVPPPPPPPPDPKALKKAKAKSKKKGRSQTPVPPPPPPPEPEDPFYQGIAGMKKVQSDKLDWSWAESITIDVPVPFLTTPQQAYAYMQRGVKVTLIQRKLHMAPPVVKGPKKPKKKLPKGQKPNLWEAVLVPEVVESTPILSFVASAAPLLQGYKEANFQFSIALPPPPPPVTPVKKKAANLDKPAQTTPKKEKTPVKIEELKPKSGPMVVTGNIRLHFDKSPADLLKYPPDIGEPILPVTGQSTRASTGRTISPNTPTSIPKTSTTAVK